MNNIMMYKRISAVAVNTNLVTEIVREIFSISPTNMSFEVGDSLGLFVPVVSDLSVFFQNGGSYGNIYQRRSNPTDQLFFNETSTDAKDYPLVEVTTGLFMVNVIIFGTIIDALFLPLSSQCKLVLSYSPLESKSRVIYIVSLASPWRLCYHSNWLKPLYRHITRTI